MFGTDCSVIEPCGNRMRHLDLAIYVGCSGDSGFSIPAMASQTGNGCGLRMLDVAAGGSRAGIHIQVTTAAAQGPVTPLR